MENNWITTQTTWALNAAFFALFHVVMLMQKNLPPRHSLIPNTRQKFLYWYDFYTMSIGDLFCVPWIISAFVQMMQKRNSIYSGGGSPDTWEWARENFGMTWQWEMGNFGMIGLASVLVFLAVCLSEKHKWDYGFPSTGKISAAGVLHLFYLGGGVAISTFCVWSIYTAELRGQIMWLALAGGAGWLLCLVADFWVGNFEKIKRTRPPNDRRATRIAQIKHQTPRDNRRPGLSFFKNV